MRTKVLIMLLGLAAVAIPAVAPAGQGPVRFADRQVPAVPQVTDAAWRLLLADPAATQPFSLALPRRFTTLEPAGGAL